MFYGIFVILYQTTREQQPCDIVQAYSDLPVEIWRGSDFPGKGLLMSWWGETIFSCETYEDEIEANLDVNLSVSWKVYL